MVPGFHHEHKASETRMRLVQRMNAIFLGIMSLDRLFGELRVTKPNLQWHFGQSLAEEVFEMFGDTLTGGRSHLLDDFLGVLIQKLVHRLADHVVAVYLIDHAEPGTAQAEVH